jgi:hypothetical protein
MLVLKQLFTFLKVGCPILREIMPHRASGLIILSKLFIGKALYNVWGALLI